MKKLMAIAIVAIFTLSGSMVMAQPPQGGQGGRGQQPSVEERVEQLKEQLDLSDEQCAQIIEMESNREMPERGDREAMQAMMEAEKEKMKEILTEEQYTAWEKMQSERRPQQGQRQRQ